MRNPTDVETTHCANCGAEVPVDSPHRLGECMTAATLTLADFLLQRIADDEAVARDALERGFGGWEDFADRGVNYEERTHIARHDPVRVLTECSAKRAIVELHKSWPVLLETPPKFETGNLDDIDSMTLRMSKQVMWATEDAYRTRFGTEPPTAPMLRALAAVYADHPDYDESWRP